MAFPQYEYTEKEVKINRKTYKAHFVKPHTRIEGIIYEWYDKNADDRPWANRSDWHLTFFVLWKDMTKWEKIYYNNLNFCGRASLNEVLFAFETDKLKNKVGKENRIKELKLRIEKDRKELSQLLKG